MYRGWNHKLIPEINTYDRSTPKKYNMIKTGPPAAILTVQTT
jgi:hypothetical protein